MINQCARMKRKGIKKQKENVFQYKKSKKRFGIQNISKEYLNSFKSPSSSNFSSSPSLSSSLSISPRFAFIAASEQYFRLQQNNQINQLKQQQTQKQQTYSLPQLPPGILFRRPPPFFQLSTSLPFPIPFIPPPNSFSETASSTTIPQPFIRPPPFFPSFFPSFGGPLGNFANLAMTAKKQNEKSFTIVETLKEDKNNKEKIIKRRKSLIHCKTRKRPFPSKLNFIINNNGNNDGITKTKNDINCETQNVKILNNFMYIYLIFLIVITGKLFNWKSDFSLG
uniref:Uncharacterized protein n=1 Tax=Meloidogyne enterolobii TaxID=390850 RepID=A0A6V7TKF1_MELEN|nr:unnamed protein product [Meloidogyne enterolobii]